METYEVIFWLLDKDTGFWKERHEEVEAKGKSSHDFVARKIKNKYGNANVKITKVIYH